MRRKMGSFVVLAGAAVGLLVLASAVQSQGRSIGTGDYAVTVTGPDTITTSYCCAPERFDYGISVQRQSKR